MSPPSTPETQPSSTTSSQTAYWQTRASAWLRYADQLDAQLDVFGIEAQRTAQSRLGVDTLGGINVLDVGCGSGRTTLQLAQAAQATDGASDDGASDDGASGFALGVDVNDELLALASERATSEAISNAAFVCADASSTDLLTLTDRAPAGGYDVIYSRFGVMFFADPAAAFANLLAATRPAGVLAFVCWGPSHRNPWMTTANRAAMELVSFDAPQVDPFSFGEPSSVSSYVAEAGWVDAQIEPFTPDVTLFGGGTAADVVGSLIELGPVGAALEGATAAERQRVTEAMVDALRPHETDGGVTLASAAWVVSAVAPS